MNPHSSLFGEEQRPDPGDGGNRAYFLRYSAVLFAYIVAPMGLDFKLSFNLRIQFWCSSLFVWALKEVLQWKRSHYWYLFQIQVIITILSIIKTTCLLFRVWMTKDRIYDILSYFPIQSQIAWWSCTQKKFYNTYNKYQTNIAHYESLLSFFK